MGHIGSMDWQEKESIGVPPSNLGGFNGKVSIDPLASILLKKCLDMFAATPNALPAANPAYPLTCSNPCAGFKFLTFQNNKHQNPKT